MRWVLFVLMFGFQSAWPSEPSPTLTTHSSAEWWLVYITGALAVFTLGLMGFTWKLWRSTSKLVEDANISEAPFILPDQVWGEGILENTSHRPRILHGFKNHGKSPAIIRRWRDYSLYTGKLPPVPDFQEQWNDRPEHYIPVASGENGGLIVVHLPTGITREQVLSGMKESAIWFYAIGEVEYEDIFGVVRIQGYCLKVVGVSKNTEGIGLTEKVHFLREGGRAYNYRKLK